MLTGSVGEGGCRRSVGAINKPSPNQPSPSRSSPPTNQLPNRPAPLTTSRNPHRGAYMVNWSPKLGTAVSDLEVEYSEEPGYLYYFK